MSWLTLLLCLLPLASGHVGHEHHEPGNDEHMSGMDMKLTKRQTEILHGDAKKSRAEGSVVATPWAYGYIPYNIQTGDFSRSEEEWIRRAMRDWEKFTCIRFADDNADRKHKVLIRKGSGCWAHLGQMEQNPQIVNLQTGAGCFWKGLIHHELGHTIGLIHEHQRENRDAYIRVNYFKVMSNMIDAVEKYSKGADDKMGLPYDYESVMHYSKTAFSAEFYDQTIHTRDPQKDDVIGMTLLPSFYDYALVNLMYNCAGHCRKTCPSDCFVNKDCGCTCKRDMVKENCRDTGDDCAGRAKRGSCIDSYGTMHTECRKSCGICKTDGSTPELVCTDVYSDCAQKKREGKCESDRGTKYRHCRKTCNTCQTANKNPGQCTDKRGSGTCKSRADRGDCQRNMREMLTDCTKSCDFCPEQVGQDPATKPGCVDYDAGACVYRADSNICHKHYALMGQKCPKACGRCNFRLPSGCADSNPDCPGWAFKDECVNNPGYMLDGCQLSCDTCKGLNKPQRPCENYNLNCDDYSKRKECFSNTFWMLNNCRKSCNACPGQRFGIPCEDFNSGCKEWADKGECENNRGWMYPHCPLSCKQCRPGTVDYNDGSCKDNNWGCFYWYAIGECENRPNPTLKVCPKSCKVCKN